MNNKNYNEISEFFPELSEWIRSSINEFSLEEENLEILYCKQNQNYRSETIVVGITYKIDINGAFYYDFKIEALKIRGAVNSSLLFLSGKYRYQNEYLTLIEDSYDILAWKKIVKKIKEIERRKEEII